MKLGTIVVLSGIMLSACAITAMAAMNGAGYSAKLVAPDALTTDAPLSVVMPAVHKVYEELRLRHYMDTRGQVRFADGTSTDTDKQESARSTGDFAQGFLSFHDPDGHQITIRSYASPDLGTLVAWEYLGGKEVQDISVIIQQELARQGVTLR